MSASATPDPTASVSKRRAIPFAVPAAPVSPSDAKITIDNYDGLVAKREAHIDTLERQALLTRDLIIKVLGPNHQLVGQVNAMIAQQSGLWT